MGQSILDTAPLMPPGGYSVPPADKLTVQFPEIKQVHSLPTKPAENMKNPNLGPTEPQKGMAQHTALGPAPSPEETASELCAPK